MLRFRRPQEPPEFSARARRALQKLEEKVRRGATLSGKDFNDQIWKDQKPIFARRQRSKCGYCESNALAGQHGDVEHYRPKSVLHRLSDNPAEEGRCQPGVAHPDGRVFHPVCATGYWWLAYEWSNYLFACAICNESFKKALFPVLE